MVDDDELLELVEMEIRELLLSTSTTEQHPCIPGSALGALGEDKWVETVKNL